MLLVICVFFGVAIIVIVLVSIDLENLQLLLELLLSTILLSRVAQFYMSFSCILFLIDISR